MKDSGWGPALRKTLLLLFATVGGAHAAPTGTVVGKITEAATASPLSGVSVSAVQGSTTIKQATTDAAGAYTLSLLKVGTYSVVATKSGYAANSAAGVSVVQSKTTTVNLALTPLPPTTGQISGTISDSLTLGPVAGATVSAKQGATAVGSAATDPSGRYLLTDLLPGAYNVEASAPGYVTRTLANATVAVGGTTTVNLALTAGDLGTRLASVSSAGAIGNGASQAPSVSADGRYVAFASSASNLVAGDTKGVADVFVHDFTTGATERVSVAAGGAEARAASSAPSISGDGRYVAFVSSATNLVSSDGNRANDVFVRDRVSGTTTLVSKSSTGVVGNASSWSPVISAEGRFVAFASDASNLVSGDTNSMRDVFVHDRVTAATELVSRSASGVLANGYSETPAISADGRFVVFHSAANNLVPSDTNGFSDLFLRDRLLGTLERISVGSSGNQADSESFAPSISDDGRYVAFHSYAGNLVSPPISTVPLRWRAFLRDRQAGTTELLSVTAAGAAVEGFNCRISSDGRFVAFESGATDLVPGDTNAYRDVFVRDRMNRITRRISVSSGGGGEANGTGAGSALSRGGRFAAFWSDASNLVGNDVNGYTDVFLRDSWGGATPPAPDTDGDGVPDASDSCPGTPSGHAVDARGCASSQRDTDADGIKDDRDLCSNTPAGQPVDANGCAASQRDTDGDGVMDDRDVCPNSPGGQPVGADGCTGAQRDTDGDGVSDFVETKLGTDPLGAGTVPVTKIRYDYAPAGGVHAIQADVGPE